MTARTTVVSRVPILFTSAAGTLIKHFLVFLLTKELYFTILIFKIFSKNNVAQRKQTIFLMTRDRNSAAKSPQNGFSPLLRTSCCKLPNQVRQERKGMGKVWNKSRNAECFCHSQKTKLFSAGGKNLIKKRLQRLALYLFLWCSLRCQKGQKYLWEKLLGQSLIA